VLLSQASTTAVADFIVWVLPLPSFYNAKLPIRKRLSLLALFSFGSFVVVAACMRAYWIHFVVEETFDVTWWGVYLWMWTAVEVQLGIICGCVPWLRSLVTFTRTSRGGVIEIADKKRYTSWSARRQMARDSVSKGTTVVGLYSMASHDKENGKGGTVIREDSLDLESCPGSPPAVQDLQTLAYPRPTCTLVGPPGTPQLLPASTPGLAL
jgi:hypothetical protein